MRSITAYFDLNASRFPLDVSRTNMNPEILKLRVPIHEAHLSSARLSSAQLTSRRTGELLNVSRHEEALCLIAPQSLIC